VTGGYENNRTTVINTTELYDPGLGYKSAWRPEITDLRLTQYKRLRVEGSRFQGRSQASGGTTEDSATNYPILQVRSIDSSRMVFLPVDPDDGWSDTRLGSIPLTDFPQGPALATIFTNGIPSASRYFVVPGRER
jgi:hypothetical protein